MSGHGGGEGGGNTAALKQVLAEFGFKVETAELKHGEHEAHSFIEKIEHGFAKLQTVALGFFGLKIANEIKNEIAETIDGLDNLKKNAQELGVTEETFELWSYAANLADVSTEQLAGSMRKLSMAVSNVGQEGGKELTALFAKLGVKTKVDGQLKSLDELLPEIAENFHKLKPGIEQVDATTKLFGRGAGRMTLLLQGGAKGVEKLRDELEDLTGGLDEDTIASAEEFNDELTRWHYGIEGVKRDLVRQLLPTLQDAIGGVLDLVKRFQAWNKETGVLHHVLKAISFAAIAAGAKGMLSLLGKMLPMIRAITAAQALSAAGWIIAYLAFDDFVSLLQGKDSVIGAMLNKLFGPDAAKNFAQFWKDIWKEASGFFDDMHNRPQKFADDWKIATDGIKSGNIFGWLGIEMLKFFTGSKTENTLRDNLHVMFDEIKKDFTAFLEWVADAPGRILRGAGGIIGKFFDKVADYSNRAGTAIRYPGSMGSVNTGSFGGMSGGGSSQQIGDTTVNVVVPPGTPTAVANNAARLVGKTVDERNRMSIQSLEPQVSR